MATQSQVPRPENKVRSESATPNSVDSGYESLSSSQIPGLPDSEYQTTPSVSKERIKTHPAIFQCSLCPKRFTRAYNLHSHLRTHSDERPFICTVCGKAFARQHDQKRHEGLHSGEKKFVCKGKLKQDRQWGCGRRFPHADALGRHFRSEAGRICIKPLLVEEMIDHQHRREEKQSTEHNIPEKQELVPALHMNESGTYTLPAALLVQYPGLATLDWSKFSLEDAGYDANPSGRSSFDTRGEEYYSNIDESYLALQPSIKEEIPEQLVAASSSKEPDTSIFLGSDFAAKISEKSEPKDSTDDKIEPLAIPENKASFSSSAVSSNDGIDIKSEPCIGTLIKVSEQAGEPAREPSLTNNNTPMEIIPRDEVLGDYDCHSAASTTESDFEDNESSEAETTSSEASSQSSFISPVIEAYKREVVEGLMAEFEALLGHSLGVRGRATSTGSSNSSSPPRSSAEQPSQQGVSGRGKRKERDEDDSRSSKGDGDDDRYKKAQVGAPSNDLSPRKFACPYYRRNSQKHKKHRSCAGPGWISVHRVKEHVFRQHCLPIHCHRCCTIFKTELDLAAHQRLPQGCEVKVVELPEGCTKEQEKLLRKRKTGSEENKWRDMFKCLFPDDSADLLPTPYYDVEQVAPWESRRDDEFARYEQYLGQELPRVVRRRLEQVVSESTRPVESELRSQLVNIVRDAQSALFRSYRQTNMPPSSSAQLEQEEFEAGQAQMNSFNVQEPPLILDFSAFFAPPPVTDSYSNPIGVDISASLLGNPAGNYQPTSDSGYSSNNIGFNVSGGRYGGYDSGANGESSNLFNGEAALPPTSQGLYQNLDSWFQ